MINGLGRCDWAFGRAVRGIDVNVGFGFRGSIRERRELDRIRGRFHKIWARFGGSEGARSQGRLCEVQGSAGLRLVGVRRVRDRR